MDLEARACGSNEFNAVEQRVDEFDGGTECEGVISPLDEIGLDRAQDQRFKEAEFRKTHLSKIVHAVAATSVGAPGCIGLQIVLDAGIER